MKHYILPKLVLVVLSFVSIVSCKEEPIMTGFHGNNKLYLQVVKSLDDNVGALYVDRDSAHYRFAFQAEDVTEDTVLIAVSLMGDQVDHDRAFSLEVDKEASTAAAEDYVLPTSFTMPAGRFLIHIPLVIRRSSRIRDQEAILKINLASNALFQIEEANPNRSRQRTSFRIYWSDILTRPDWWVGSFENFGAYSRTKHRFILDVFQVSPTRFENVYEVDEFGWISEVNDAQLSVAISLNHDMLNRRLDHYNLQHPDALLRNEENGKLIRFCTTCD